MRSFVLTCLRRLPRPAATPSQRGMGRMGLRFGLKGGKEKSCNFVG